MLKKQQKSEAGFKPCQGLAPYSIMLRYTVASPPFLSLLYPLPPQNEAAFDLTLGNKPHAHIYSWALSGGGTRDVIVQAFFFSLLHSASYCFFQQIQTNLTKMYSVYIYILNPCEWKQYVKRQLRSIWISWKNKHFAAKRGQNQIFTQA